MSALRRGRPLHDVVRELRDRIDHGTDEELRVLATILGRLDTAIHEELAFRARCREAAGRSAAAHEDAERGEKGSHNG